MEEQAALAAFSVTQRWFSKTRAGSPDAQISGGFRWLPVPCPEVSTRSDCRALSCRHTACNASESPSCGCAVCPDCQRSNMAASPHYRLLLTWSGRPFPAKGVQP